MGLFASLSTVVPPGPMRAMTSSEYSQAFYGGDPVPEPWLGSALGGMVSPDLALTLSYVYSAVRIISDDFGSMACQMFQALPDGGRKRVEYGMPGIGHIARLLRWGPNAIQTAKAFWSTLAWQYLLRPAAYAEIVRRPGTLAGMADEIVPRHPDRVREHHAPQPDGTTDVSYTIIEPHGPPRIVSDDAMIVVRNTSADGLSALSPIHYASRALVGALALQEFTKNYFAKGATAALSAIYKGPQKTDEEIDAVHTMIRKYLSGPENAGGVLVLNGDFDIKALGVDPEKAQLLGLKNLSGRDVARMFKMPPSWLGIEGAQSYNSQVQDAANYVNRCQIPMVVEFEQAIARDLILAPDRFFAKFNMDYLLRASTKERFDTYAVAVKSRVMRPSECRIKEDMNPDPALDRLSELDNQPGRPVAPAAEPEVPRASAHAHVKGLLAVHDNAIRCLRRERAAAEKIAKKRARDAEGWQADLRAFYEEHAGFIAQTMRMRIEDARGYAAQHGAQLETTGLALFDEQWERAEADELAALALDEPAATAA